VRRCLLVLVLLVLLGVAPAAGAICVVPGAREPLDRIWRPDMRAAAGFAHQRSGDIAFAVRTAHRFYGYRPDHVEWSASVVKAMLMVAYLNRPSVANRPLNGYDLSLLVPMITHSDNNAASTVDGIVGNAGLDALARRVHMSHFTPVANPWGATRITARDQTSFFLHIDRYIPARHRYEAMHLLGSITPSQRWGIGEVAPRGWKLYFKGGWGSGTGLLDHQVVLLTRGCARVSLAVLSMYDGSHAYGKATLRGMFARLLDDFPTGAPLYPVVPGGHYQAALRGPNGHAIGVIGFTTTGNGQQLRHAVARVTATATCPGFRQVFPGSVAVDPHGRFAATSSSATGAVTLALRGRFAAHRTATGTLRIRVAGATGCAATAGWVARAPG
jgi:hypothetical protein